MAAAEPRLRDRVLTVSGVSKTYAMTGWRIGFAAGPRALVKAMVNMQGQVSAGVSTVGQAAAAAALDGPQDAVPAMRAAYRRRRELVVDALNQAPGLLCHRPAGAFYVYPNVAGCLGKTTPAGRLLQTDEDVAMALLQERHVATVFGQAFGMSPYLRISYATADGQLMPRPAAASRRFATACAEVRPRRGRPRRHRPHRPLLGRLPRLRAGRGRRGPGAARPGQLLRPTKAAPSGSRGMSKA